MADNGAGRWVLCQEPGDPCFDIIIKNLDQMNQTNPMKDETLTIEADVVLKLGNREEQLVLRVKLIQQTLGEGANN